VVTELELQSTHADNASYGQRITACALGFESSRRALASSPGMWVRKQREGVCAPGDFAESKITLLHRLLGAVRMPHLRGNGRGCQKGDGGHDERRYQHCCSWEE
jgi:hypothetical protein